VSHAEQKAWTAAKGHVQARFESSAVAKVTLEFVVDQKICSDCQDWFEGTLYPKLEEWSEENNEKPFTLDVTVDGNTVHVFGENETSWPDTVGDDPRELSLDRLREILVATGGLGDNQISIYDSAGDRTDYDYYTQDKLEELLREHDEEIKQSEAYWTQFQKSGMVLTGSRAEISFDEVHEEAEGIYQREGRRRR
jgi:hypothetical protein